MKSTKWEYWIATLRCLQGQYFFMRTGHLSFQKSIVRFLFLFALINLGSTSFGDGGMSQGSGAGRYATGSGGATGQDSAFSAFGGGGSGRASYFDLGGNSKAAVIKNAPDGGFVEILFAVALVVISSYFLFDGGARTIKKDRKQSLKIRDVTCIVRIVGACAAALLILLLSFWWFFASHSIVPPSFKGFFEIVLAYPRHFTPGLWVASFILSAFSLHSFFLLAFDERYRSTESEDGGKSSSTLIVPTVHMTFSFAAFLVSILRITEAFAE